MPNAFSAGGSMPKGLKIGLILLLPLALALGAAYGLAKIHVIKLPPNPALRPLWKAIGLKPPTVPAPAALAANAPDPLLEQKKALDAEKMKLAEERAALEESQQAQAKPTAPAAADPNALDPRSVARMATVYEQMPTEKAVTIFAILPDAQALALLRGMDEKKVAEILAAEPPARAARFTLALAQKK